MTIQIASALLEGCVLSFLSKEDAYGYKLTQSVKETLDISESTLYPVMRRLQTDKCLTAYDEPHNGRNRRYYQITEYGTQKLRECSLEWSAFKGKIDSYLGGIEK